MTRQQEFSAAINKITLDMIKSKCGEPKMLHADMYWNMETLGYTWDCTTHIIASGLQKNFIAKMNMQVCKKTEAAFLLTIGEKTECGCFIVGRYKNYWLRNN